MDKTVGLKLLEAVGPTANHNIIQLTFQTIAAPQQFAKVGDFTVKGRHAKVYEII